MLQFKIFFIFSSIFVLFSKPNINRSQQAKGLDFLLVLRKILDHLRVAYKPFVRILRLLKFKPLKLTKSYFHVLPCDMMAQWLAISHFCRLQVQLSEDFKDVSKEEELSI